MARFGILESSTPATSTVCQSFSPVCPCAPIVLIFIVPYTNHTLQSPSVLLYFRASFVLLVMMWGLCAYPLLLFRLHLLLLLLLLPSSSFFFFFFSCSSSSSFFFFFIFFICLVFVCLLLMMFSLLLFCLFRVFLVCLLFSLL